MKLNEQHLKTIGNIINTFHFKLNANEWFSEYQYMYILNDTNNVNNEYRVLVDIDDNCVIFQYIDNECDEIIDLHTYNIATKFCTTNSDLVENCIMLIVSILHYYMYNIHW